MMMMEKIQEKSPEKNGSLSEKRAYVTSSHMIPEGKAPHVKRNHHHHDLPAQTQTSSALQSLHSLSIRITMLPILRNLCVCEPKGRESLPERDSCGN